MAGGGGRSGRAKRIDFAVAMLFGAVVVGGLFLIVAGFAMEPDGCGGRFREPCESKTYWSVGGGFGLIFVGAPLVGKLAPEIPPGEGPGRGVAIAALFLGATAGVALAAAAIS